MFASCKLLQWWLMLEISAWCYGSRKQSCGKMTRFKTFAKDKKQKYPKELHRNPKAQKHPEIIRGFANLEKNRIFVSMHGIARLLHFLVFWFCVLCS